MEALKLQENAEFDWQDFRNSLSADELEIIKKADEILNDYLDKKLGEESLKEFLDGKNETCSLNEARKAILGY